VVPIQNTLPDINPDEVLSALDADTRDYLRLLLSGGAQGLKGQSGLRLSATFRRFEPTARDILKITKKIAERRNNLSRVIHNFQLLSTELSTKDDQISGLVSSSNAVFASFARQDANLRATLRLLPPALSSTRRGLTKADALARELGPTLQALRPTARALGPTLRQTRPFLRQTTPIIRDQLRPFSRAALPTVRLLRPTIQDLAKLTPDLVTTGRVVNYLLNELAFNPPGDREEGYLFWASWANHAGASVFSTQDANGIIRRGLFVTSCSSLGVLGNLAEVNPNLNTITQLLNAPKQSDACPQSAGAQGGAQTPKP
jgi:phospholipid/cholesterol/gamma-HCH transport system substrate-binding protein